MILQVQPTPDAVAARAHSRAESLLHHCDTIVARYSHTIVTWPLQAYDFLELSRRLDVKLQFGGSDQWGNIVNGVELARRCDQKSVFGFTAPLLTTSDGKKMGKTADGAVWLNEDLLSPFEYWQFWRNTADADVGRFLRIFTELPQVRMKRGPVGWSTVRDGARGASTGSIGWPHALFVGPLR